MASKFGASRQELGQRRQCCSNVIISAVAGGSARDLRLCQVQKKVVCNKSERNQVEDEFAVTKRTFPKLVLPMIYRPAGGVNLAVVAAWPGSCSDT